MSVFDRSEITEKRQKWQGLQRTRTEEAGKMTAKDNLASAEILFGDLCTFLNSKMKKIEI